MLKRDFLLLKNNYLKNCFTQTDNEAVLTIYAFILKNEGTDSDFWNTGIGCDELGHMLFGFNEDDWQCLEQDLPNWSADQINIFTQCIVTGNIAHTVYTDTEKITMDKRAELIPLLLKIENERNAEYMEVGMHITDNIQFLEMGNSKSKALLQSIKDWYDEKEWKSSLNGETIQHPASVYISRLMEANT